MPAQGFPNGLGQTSRVPVPPDRITETSFTGCERLLTSLMKSSRAVCYSGYARAKNRLTGVPRLISTENVGVFKQPGRLILGRQGGSHIGLPDDGQFRIVP